MSELRIIKKYSNRRLYDTQLSRYITLQDIKKMVEGFVPFKIIDAKTHQDLTRSTLLLVIVDAEDRGTPIFSADILVNIIRFYGDSTQALVSRFLQHSLLHFSDQQGKLKGPMSSLGNKDGASNLNKVTAENLDNWNDSQS